MLLATALAAVAATQAAQPNQPAPLAPAPDYSSAEAWICSPLKSTDICRQPLAEVDLGPARYGTPAAPRPAAQPKLDCFYVYPTVSRDAGMNSDLAWREEGSPVRSQVGALSPVCRPFAPVYRQLTTRAIAAVGAGINVLPMFETAYTDVRAAWRAYARANPGRRVVLVGHSQGSWILKRLIAEEIERGPDLARVELAVLPGFNLMVPDGRRVGGDFKRMPLCSSATERGCVISYVTYRTGNVPPDGALFGDSTVRGQQVACTNPQAPGATGWVALDSLYPAALGDNAPGGRITWSTSGPPPAPMLRFSGLLSARCVKQGRKSWLEMRINADPADARTDRIGGEAGAMGFYLPGWGMHLNDPYIALGGLRARLAAMR